MLCWFLHESTWHFLITSCTAAWWLVLGAYNRVWHQRQLKYAQGSRSADTQAAWRSQENTIKEIKLEPKLKVLIKVGQWFFSNSTASSSAWEDGGKGDKPGEERGHPGCLDKIWRMAYCVRVPGLLESLHCSLFLVDIPCTVLPATSGVWALAFHQFLGLTWRCFLSPTFGYWDIGEMASADSWLW